MSDASRTSSRDPNPRGAAGRFPLAVVGAVAVFTVTVASVVALGQRSGDPVSTEADRIVQGVDLGRYDGPLAPVTRADDGSTVMAQPRVGTPVLEVFEDFQCPECHRFQKRSGPTIKRLAAGGLVRVVYRPYRSFEDGAEPEASNSLRAANAALCAPARHWADYRDVLYAHQPEEGEPGFEAVGLVDWGRRAGIGGAAFAACVRGLEKSGEVERMTRYAVRTREVDSAPTVVLNGRRLGRDVLRDRQALERAVRTARRD